MLTVQDICARASANAHKNLVRVPATYPKFPALEKPCCPSTEVKRLRRKVRILSEFIQTQVADRDCRCFGHGSCCLRCLARELLAKFQKAEQ
jgi:hypothetical protein